MHAAGIAASECLPGVAAQCQHVARYCLATVHQCLKIFSVKASDVAARRNQREIRACVGEILRREAGKKIEQLNELKLVVQIPLEPENDCVVIGKAAEGVVALREILPEILEISKVTAGQVFRADSA